MTAGAGKQPSAVIRPLLTSWGEECSTAADAFHRTRFPRVASPAAVTENADDDKLHSSKICPIKPSKEHGSRVHRIAARSTDIAMSTMPFRVKAIDDNRIARVLLGIPEMETSYFRCPSK